MIRGLVFLGLLLVVIRAGFIYVSPVVKNTMLEGKMQDLSSNRGLKTEYDLRKELLDFIEENRIDLKSDQIYFELTKRGCAMAAHYTTTATFWKYTRTYEFFPASSESARNKCRSEFRLVARARS